MEETVRFITQRHHEDYVREMSCDRFWNMACLVLVAPFLAPIYHGQSARLKILAHHIPREIRRIFVNPDSCYYVLEDGIQTILTRTAEGVLHPG